MNPTSQSSITLAAWNVNSVRARLPVVLDWLQDKKPDVVCLQETKCEDKNFPTIFEEELGYNVAHFGQKTFNGVAILSKYPLDDITRGLPNFDYPDLEPQSRYIEAGMNIGAHYLRVASVYVPNGQDLNSDKYPYKLAFLKALHQRMDTLSRAPYGLEEMSFFCGDYNIAPRDCDVYDPAHWGEDVLCSPRERAAFFSLTHLGYRDMLDALPKPAFTWWDYRAGAFQKNNGLRIDHILASPRAADHCIAAPWIDDYVRGMEKTSDHAPVCVKITL